MSTPKKQSPPANAAAPQNEMVEVGSVALEIVSGVTAMQQRMQEILLEMGRIEMKKANLVFEIRRLENQSQTLLRQEAERLGIPEGVPWQLTPDGKALTAVTPAR